MAFKVQNSKWLSSECFPLFYPNEKQKQKQRIVNLEIIVMTLLFCMIFNLLFKVLYIQVSNHLVISWVPNIRIFFFCLCYQNNERHICPECFVFGSLLTPFSLFFCHQKSLMWNLVLSILHHYFKKPFSTDVTLLETCVSDVIGRRFEKVRNGHRFETWTQI